MAKNPAHFGFGVSGNDKLTLRFEIHKLLKHHDFKRLTVSFFWITDIDPTKLSDLVEQVRALSCTTDAALRFLSVNACQGFSLNAHYGTMK